MQMCTHQYAVYIYCWVRVCARIAAPTAMPAALLLLGMLVARVHCIRLVSLPAPPSAVFSELSQDALGHLPQLVAAHRYHSETHTVHTQDGYILTLYRVRNRTASVRRGRPVLLMHGLLLSAECFVDAGPSAGLAYLLADRGLDVWVGNQRGNHHGRRHRRLDPDHDRQFWEFSYHEMGLYDQSAIVDYVATHTGRPTIDYVGYSEGGAAFLILCSERPRYLKKFNVAILLSPSTRMMHTRSPVFRAAVNALSGEGERLPRVYLRGIETLLYALESPPHLGSIARRTLRAMEGHFPAGTSARTLTHFSQALNSEEFLALDYGVKDNMRVYGKARPVRYSLKAVSVPVVLVSARGDMIVDERDVSWLSEQLPRVLEYRTVRDPLWNHFDFPYSKHVATELLPIILKYINNTTI